MEYNVLIPRSGGLLTANPEDWGGIGALALLPELSQACVCVCDWAGLFSWLRPGMVDPLSQALEPLKRKLIRMHTLAQTPYASSCMQMNMHARSVRHDTVS